MNARFYVPEIGRFASADPLIPNPANPQSLNRYSYVYNNPINMVDPSGHAPCNMYCAEHYIDQASQWIGGGFETMFNEGVKYAKYAVTALGIVTVGSGAQAVASSPSLISTAASVDIAAKGFVASHPVTSAAVGGVAETAFECLLTGGGCVPGDFAMGAVTAGMSPAGGGRQAPCPHSFSGDTLVSTADGYIAISDVEYGDYVLAFNEDTGEIGYYPVTDMFRHYDPVVVHLVIDGELIETTPKHRFYETVSDELQAHFVDVIGWWSYAEQLEVGDYIYQADGTAGQVESITFVQQPQWMYDLTVDVAHTFFVGDGDSLVHNCDDEAVHSALRSISDKYNNLECKECAKEMQQWLTVNDIGGNTLTLRGGGDYIISGRAEQVGQAAPISRNSFHYGVEARGLVFDNLPNTGLLRQDWINDFHAIGGVRLHNVTPFDG